MTSIKQSLKFLLKAELLAVMAFALWAPSNAFARDKEPETTPDASLAAKAFSERLAQNAGTPCAKTVTLTQIKAVAAKLRQFQAKQQAKNKKESKEIKVEEQATNRRP
jgi:tRNA nucleotidyltransferase/poly(A) polymerase